MLSPLHHSSPPVHTALNQELKNLNPSFSSHLNPVDLPLIRYAYLLVTQITGTLQNSWRVLPARAYCAAYRYAD
jgi:hypothetical protein